jgi:ribosome-binding protein aMBF1 (putative translation factor)
MSFGHTLYPPHQLKSHEALFVLLPRDEPLDASEKFAAQVRAARGLLGWSQGDLADRAGLARTVVVRLELGITDSRISSVHAISEAFSKAGVVFLNEPNGNYGVLRNDPSS